MDSSILVQNDLTNDLASMNTVQNFVRDALATATEIQKHPMILPPDAVILHHTLVADGALPSGVETEFSSIGSAVNVAAKRQDCKAAGKPWIHEHRLKQARQVKEVKTSADQFILAAEKAPRRYKPCFQRSLYSGPTARKDARSQWIEILAAMLIRTSTPPGKVFAETAWKLAAPR